MLISRCGGCEQVCLCHDSGHLVLGIHHDDGMRFPVGSEGVSATTDLSALQVIARDILEPTVRGRRRLTP
jgi:hypothetical protein